MREHADKDTVITKLREELRLMKTETKAATKGTVRSEDVAAVNRRHIEERALLQRNHDEAIALLKSKCTRDRESAERKMGDLELQLASLGNKNDAAAALRAKLSSLEKTNRQLESSLSAQASEVETLQRQLAESVTAVAVLTERCTGKDNLLAEIAKRKRSTEARFTSMAVAVASLCIVAASL